MKIAIQGQRGSFHDEAAKKFFTEITTLVPCDSFAAVFRALQDGQADYGVVAVENSLFGSIHETYDQLLASDVIIIGEIALRIKQCLIAQPDVRRFEITTVVSHPAALDQCREFLARELPTAAIASRHAAQLHAMQIIAEDIADEPDNITRFIVLCPRPHHISNANKASLILTTSHQPGALYHSLGILAENNCNMTKIESRPVRAITSMIN